MVTLNDTVEKNVGHTEADIGAETLMMQVSSGRYYSVDGPAQTIWANIEGPTSVNGLVDLLLTRFDVDRETCEAETIAFLKDLHSNKLVVTK